MKNLICTAKKNTVITYRDEDFTFAESVYAGDILLLTEAEEAYSDLFHDLCYYGNYRGDAIVIFADEYDIEEDVVITYEELMALAKEHYNDGGDATYECCDEQWFNTYVSLFGNMTKGKALKMFYTDAAVRRDIEATAW